MLSVTQRSDPRTGECSRQSSWAGEGGVGRGAGTYESRWSIGVADVHDCVFLF